MASGDPQTAPITVRALTRVPYAQALEDMRRFTATRTEHTPDEIWLVEHPPVFTLGLATRPEHLLDTGDIAVVQTERGGQVTYHGPGQLVAYLMIDLRRRHLMVRDLVCRIESAIIATLSDFGVRGVRKSGAPGIYLPLDNDTPGPKIAALGLKISQGRSYHGLALNVDMDLAPFARINPCGYAGLEVVDVRRAQERAASAGGASATAPTLERVAPTLAENLIASLR